MAQIKISSLPSGTPKGTDLTPATDTLDTSSAPTGTTKKYTRSSELNFYLAAQGYRTLTAVTAASTGALTATYANGALGVGATLTNAGAMAALTLDGVTLAVSDRVLIKNQASSLQNGIYTVTTVGTGAVNWVLTRATDYDQAAEVIQFDVVLVNQGTVSAGLVYQETTPGPFTIGTTAITFAALSIPSTTLPTTDNAIARFDGVTGKLQNSAVVLDDSGNITALDGFLIKLTGDYNVFEFLNSIAGIPTAWLRITNSVAFSPSLSAQGSQANIDVQIVPKGTGFVGIGSSSQSTTGGTLRLFEVVTNGSDYVALKASDAITTSYTLTYPNAPPTVSNMFMTSSTTGTLSWANYLMNNTWTVVPYGSSTAGSPTGTFVGRYSRIGDMVFCTAQLTFTSLDTMAGNFKISGLPFTVRTGAQNRSTISASFRANWTNDFVITGFTDTGATTLSFYNAGVDNTTVVIGDMSATTQIYISFSYNTSDA